MWDRSLDTFKTNESDWSQGRFSNHASFLKIVSCIFSLAAGYGIQMLLSLVLVRQKLDRYLTMQLRATVTWRPTMIYTPTLDHDR